LIILVTLNLGRYSENFSGSGWGWVALIADVALLALLSFSLIRDFWRADA
jgi:hypothetical protein